MRTPQALAPAIISVIVFILMRFRPFSLIQYVCVFVLIHFRERFQIDSFSMKTEGLNASKCVRFQNENALVWTGLLSTWALKNLNVNICHCTVLKSSCFVRTARDAKISVNTSLNPHIKYGIFRKAPFRLSILELGQVFNSLHVIPFSQRGGRFWS